MYKVNATLLETFRRYLKTDYTTAQDVNRAIMGVFEPNRIMSLGSAFHSILERPDRLNVMIRDDETVRSTYVEQDEFRFEHADIETATSYITPTQCVEIRTTRRYETSLGVVHVVSKVDAMRGSRVEEYKTKWSQFQIDSYCDSAQWKLYLEAFQAKSVRYTVFEMKDTEGDFIDARLRDVHVFTMYPYESMHGDIMKLLESLMEYARVNNLLTFLVPKSASALIDF